MREHQFGSSTYPNASLLPCPLPVYCKESNANRTTYWFVSYKRSQSRVPKIAQAYISNSKGQVKIIEICPHIETWTRNWLCQPGVGVQQKPDPVLIYKDLRDVLPLSQTGHTMFGSIKNDSVRSRVFVPLWLSSEAVQEDEGSPRHGFPVRPLLVHLPNS